MHIKNYLTRSKNIEMKEMSDERLENSIKDR